MTGQMCVKGHLLEYESSLERDFLTLAEWNPDIVTMAAQPVRLTFSDPSGGKRSYTPDFLATYRDGRQSLHEIKFRADLKAGWKYLRPRFECAVDWCRDRGSTFHIETERKIRTPRLRNIRFLRHFSRADVDPADERALTEILARRTAMTAAELIALAGSGDPALRTRNLWALVASRRIGVNLDHPLSMSSIVHAEEGRP